jgi:hypothetical protein
MYVKGKGCEGYGLNLFGSEQGPVVESCEYGIESSGSIKERQFLD